MGPPMLEGASCTVISLYIPLTVSCVHSQVLSTPSRMAVSGSERTNTAPTAGAIEWLMPMRPLPSGPVGAGGPRGGAGDPAGGPSVGDGRGGARALPRRPRGHPLTPVRGGTPAPGDDRAARFDPRLRCHAAVGHAADYRRHHGTAPHHEGEGGQEHGKHEVHAGAGEHDEEADPDGLEVERLLRVHRVGLATLERVLVVAHHLDVAAHG